MSGTAASQLRRLLQVIPRLADGTTRTLEEIASFAGVTPATLVGDLRLLTERFGEPAGFVEGVQIYIEAERVSVVTHHFHRPMRLTLEELRALELGLAMLSAERPPDEQQAIERARERLRRATSRPQRAAMAAPARRAEPARAPDPAHFTCLRRALRDGRKVELRYQSGAAARPSCRIVCPFGLLAASGEWYLVARCEDAADVRVFRLDRIVDVTLLSDRYDRPADFSLESVIRDGRVLRTGSRATLRVRYSPAIARWLREREGVTPDEDGSLTVEHPLADPDWAVRHVLQYGPDAEVLAPDSVREEIVRRLRAITA